MLPVSLDSATPCELFFFFYYYVTSSLHMANSNLFFQNFLEFFFHFPLKKFYWNIVASQCCVRFYCTAKWTSCMYTHMPSHFLNFLRFAQMASKWLCQLTLPLAECASSHSSTLSPIRALSHSKTFANLMTVTGYLNLTGISLITSEFGHENMPECLVVVRVFSSVY